MKSLVITNRTTRRESEAFKKYLAEISRIKPFETPEAEFECAMKAFKGDARAKKELIRRNLRFVISVAKQYQMKGVSLEDLVNEGNIGITAAADRFDPTLGNKFISYAVWYIRKDIMAFLSTQSRIVKLPTNKVSNIFKYKKILSALEQELGRDVTKSDVLEYHPEYTSDDIDLLNELVDDSVASLDMPVGDDDSASLYDLLSDPSMGRADDLVMKADMDVDIDRLFSVLKPNDRDMLRMLFGLDNGVPATLADVGKAQGVSRESIRQRREKAFRIIKSRFKHKAKYLLGE